MTLASRQPGCISRRDFLKAAAVGSVGLLGACSPRSNATPTSPPITVEPTPAVPVVSIAKIKDGNIAAAVEEAIHLLGGIEAVTSGKERIMLKPNLVSNDPRATTKPEVIRALAALMKKAGKTVLIGEGSAAASGFNAQGQHALSPERSRQAEGYAAVRF